MLRTTINSAGRQISRKAALSVMAAALISSAGAVEASASTQHNGSYAKTHGTVALRNITISVPAPIILNSPIYVADKLGYFRANNINATIAVIPGGGVGETEALRSGSVQFVMYGDTDIFLARSEGIDVQAIAGMYRGYGQDSLYINTNFATSRGISRKDSVKTVLQKMKGATMGAASSTSGPSVIWDGLLRHYGFPSTWTTFVTIAPSAGFTPVTSGAVNASYSGAPTPQKAVSSGGAVIGFRGTQIPFLQTDTYIELGTLQSYANSNPAVVRGVARAIAKADAAIAHHNPNVVGAVVSSIQGVSPGIVRSVISVGIDQGVMSKAEWISAMNLSNNLKLIPTTVTPSEMANAYTNRFVK